MTHQPRNPDASFGRCRAGRASCALLTLLALTGLLSLGPARRAGAAAASVTAPAHLSANDAEAKDQLRQLLVKGEYTALERLCEEALREERKLPLLRFHRDLARRR
ncbi:hypothetical protein ACFL34_04930, partial [Candidatus Sumerlaeota bacterium]